LGGRRLSNHQRKFGLESLVDGVVLHFCVEGLLVVLLLPVDGDEFLEDGFDSPGGGFSIHDEDGLGLNIGL